jgi:glucose/mannose-6-phosphate isomerase
VTAEELLDSPSQLEAGDPEGMLRAVASAAGQVREAAVLSAEAGVARFASEDLPRAVVTLGMGGSGIAGDVLCALAGSTCPVPVISVRGHTLPSWVGAADLVVAVSCSGTTEETLSALEEAVRRGCRLLVVGADGSPLADLGRRGRGVVVPVTQGRQPRASFFSLTTPLLVAADALGLLSCSPEEVEATAVLLEQLAVRHGPTADTVLNPAKTLALELVGNLPVVWGTSGLTGVTAYRFVCQLNENAKTPAVWGSLPEAAHNQVVPFDGPFVRATDTDLFRDPVEDEEPSRTSLHLVLLRDPDEHPGVSRRADVAGELARERGIGVSALRAEGSAPFQRLASLVSLADWTSTYLALAEGLDPTPVRPIDELKARASR